jgi:hypothetical protein
VVFEGFERRCLFNLFQLDTSTLSGCCNLVIKGQISILQYALFSLERFYFVLFILVDEKKINQV